MIRGISGFVQTGDVVFSEIGQGQEAGLLSRPQPAWAGSAFLVNIIACRDGFKPPAQGSGIERYLYRESEGGDFQSRDLLATLGLAQCLTGSGVMSFSMNLVRAMKWVKVSAGSSRPL